MALIGYKYHYPFLRSCSKQEISYTEKNKAGNKNTSANMSPIRWVDFILVKMVSWIVPNAPLYKAFMEQFYNGFLFL